MVLEKLARQCILTRKAYIPGKPVEEVQREYGLNDIVKLASNENPLGTSPLAIEAMVAELKSANLYPESSCPALTTRLADWYGRRPEQFVIGTGADGIITLLGFTFINPGDEVIMGEVTFPAYENITVKMDGKPVLVPLSEDYRLDIDGFIAALTPKTKLIFLCNPNNPTGTITNGEEFNRLIEAVPEDVLVVSDEAYCDFVSEPTYPDSLPYLQRYPNLIILRTFSKVMGLAGLRLGYALAHEEIVALIMKVREPFPVNRIAQAGALAAMDDADFVRRSLQVNREGRAQLYRAFSEMGVSYVPSQANFVMVDLAKPARPIFEAMLKEGVIVRPLDFNGLPTCLRISIGTQEQNERMLAALKKALVISEGSLFTA